MTGEPRTTVVIATRNRRHELLRTLSELRRLQPQPPIIVVDNASDDGTADAVTADVPEARLIRMSRNLGAHARNLGARCAATPYIAFSDDDSWWCPGALAQAEKIFDEHPAVGLIAARTLVGDDERQDPVNEMMRRSPLHTPPDLPGPRVLGFTACSAVVRQAAFWQAGGFSRELFFVAEEKLHAYDLAAAGWNLIYVDSVVAHHHPSATRASHDHRRILELRNNLLVSWMRRSPRLATTHTALLAKSAVSDAISRRAALSAVRRLPAALLHRRRLPRRVEHEITMLEGQDA